MASTESIQHWVTEFATCVLNQDEAIRGRDPERGNEYAKCYIEAFRKLRDSGVDGMDCLATLLKDPRRSVRTTAACFLLRHRTEESLQVLRSSAEEKGVTGLGAFMTLKRWEEGTRDLDTL